MGAYRVALEQVFPGERIEVALLWTRIPQLMPLPGALLHGALAQARS
jgi:ATP-dependent helicase/nuclease subunit A